MTRTATLLALSLSTFVAACQADDAPAIGEAVAFTSVAEEDIGGPLPFGEPNVRRCPIDWVDAVLAPDGSALSVLFSGYEVYVEEGRRRGRTRCTIDIPIHLPQGQTVAVADVDYRGFADLPDAEARLWRRYRLGRDHSPWMKYEIPSGTSDDFELTDAVEGQNLIGRRCGKATKLRIQTVLEVEKPRAAADAFVVLDSVDAAGRLDFQFSWKSCPTE